MTPPFPSTRAEMSHPGDPTPLRIVVVGPLHPYRGGIARFAERLALSLMGRGHDLSALTFTRQYPAVLFPGRTQYEATHRDVGFPVVRVLDVLNPVTWWRGVRWITRQRPHLVLFNYWMPFFAPLFGAMARSLRRRGIRSIAIVHNALPHERKPGDRALGRYFLRACCGHVTLSRAVEADLVALGIREPVERAGHPAYDVYGEAAPPGLARERLGLPVDDRILLFFGFIRPYKGLQILLQAMPRIVERLPGTRLVVAGECYGSEEPYRRTVRELGLENAVDLRLRYIENGEVALYFSAADLVVQPYLSATQSGVAQIAFQFEKPVVLTDVGGLAETVEEDQAGYVVSPGDPDALSEAVIRFFAEGPADRFRAGIQAAKARHSWDHLADAVLRLERAARREGDGPPSERNAMVA